MICQHISVKANFLQPPNSTTNFSYIVKLTNCMHIKYRSQVDLVKFKQDLIRLNIVPSTFYCKNGKKFSFYWLPDCPTNEVLALRNAPNVLSQMSSPDIITAEEHNSLLATYLKKQRFDFILYCDTSCEWVGGVNVVKSFYGLEIGKYIGKSAYLGNGIAKKATLALIDYLSLILPSKTEIIARTKADNWINISLNMSIGFSTKKYLPDDFILMGRVL